MEAGSGTSERAPRSFRILFYGDESRTLKNGIAGLYGNRCNLAVVACMDGVFHLHGLEHENSVGSFDYVAHRYIY